MGGSRAAPTRETIETIVKMKPIENMELKNFAADFTQRCLIPQSRLYEKQSITEGSILADIQSSGLLNLRIPEEFSGLGLTLEDAVVVAEELAYGCSGIASAMEASELAITPLLLFGSDEQKKLFLEPLAKDTLFAGLSPLPQDNESALSFKRAKEGFQLNGECPFVFNATIGEWIFVSAQIDNSLAAQRAMPSTSNNNSASFLVPLKTPGLKVSETIHLLGRQAADLHSVIFDNVFVNELSYLEGSSDWEHFCDSIASQHFPILAGGCTGVARRALELSCGYAKERRTFGVPIASHQAIAFMLADMAKDVEAGRLLTARAARLATNDVIDHTIFRSCKAFAQEMAMQVTTDAVQIFGGYGYSKEYPVEKLMRDARTYGLFAGTTPQLKMQIGQRFLQKIQAN